MPADRAFVVDGAWLRAGARAAWHTYTAPFRWPAAALRAYRLHRRMLRLCTRLEASGAPQHEHENMRSWRAEAQSILEEWRRGR